MSRTGYRWVAALAGFQAMVGWSLFADTKNAFVLLDATLTTGLAILTWNGRPWGVYGLALVSLVGFIEAIGTGARAPWGIPLLVYGITAWKVYSNASRRSDRDARL